MKRHSRKQENIRNFRGKRSWVRKFGDAFLGMAQSVPGQSSFRVHFVAAIAVILTATWLGNFDAVRWCLLLLCIATVLAAEMFNSAIETLAKAVTDSYDPFVGRALNIAGGAVLTVCLGAAAVGIILFGESIWKLLQGSALCG